MRIKTILTIIVSNLIIFISANCINKEQTSTEKNPKINEGRKLVMESIKAHGGSEKWYNNGQLQFRWKYHMTDRGPAAIVDTLQTIDTSSLAVVHQVTGKDMTFGMNNGQAWISPKNAKFIPPARFWALTPYYFIGIPFVFNDEDANFELLDEAIDFQGKAYTQVKITYNKGSGDSPDDYYVLLIDSKTKLTRGAYYTVTSNLVVQNSPGPAKFISLDNLTDVNGVKLASGHVTYKMKHGKIADQMRYTEVSGVRFLPRNTVDLSIPDDELIIK